MDKGNKMDDQHIVTSFDKELKDLTDGLVGLGGLAQGGPWLVCRLVARCRRPAVSVSLPPAYGHRLLLR